MTIKQAIAKNRAAGSYYFTPETMRFWNCKVESGLYPHRYFVTSEDNFDRTETLYTIRQFTEDYVDVNTVGRFQAYRYKENATTAAAFLSACTEDMRGVAGFREKEILENLDKIIPFEADEECYTLIAKDGNSCVYSVERKTFVG